MIRVLTGYCALRTAYQIRSRQQVVVLTRLKDYSIEYCSYTSVLEFLTKLQLQLFSTRNRSALEHYVSVPP